MSMPKIFNRQPIQVKQLGADRISFKADEGESGDATVQSAQVTCAFGLKDIAIQAVMTQDGFVVPALRARIESSSHQLMPFYQEPKSDPLRLKMDIKLQELTIQSERSGPHHIVVADGLSLKIGFTTNTIANLIAHAPPGSHSTGRLKISFKAYHEVVAAGGDVAP